VTDADLTAKPLWSRIAEALSALAQGESLSEVFQKLRTPPERTVAFAIAVIALSAKMAKADGLVTRDEVTAFREVFHISPADEPQAAKVYNLARQDIAGYQSYARSIAQMFEPGASILEDLLEGLFHIALADGNYNEKEDEFLREVAGIFNIREKCFRMLRARFAPEAARDAYDVLGVDPGTPLADIKATWRALVRETHPDQMLARGVPPEAIALATKRLAAVNRAWDEISQKAA